MSTADPSRPRPVTLLVNGAPAPERADAARNRRKILAAAAQVLAKDGPQALAPDAVAQAAGVGVGTIYRRFGSRAGLLAALLDEREQQFQQALMAGPPPLGPGAPAGQRIRAFLHALLDHQEEQWQLWLLWDKDVAVGRYGTGPHLMYRAHLIPLIREADPAADATFLSEALLALIRPGLINYEIRELHLTMERVKAGVDHLVTRLVPD